MTVGPVNPVDQRLLTLRPVVDGSVKITGGFWAARQQVNREVTIPYGMKMLEESGTLENFRLAARASKAGYQMPLFRDSDLYKVLEAIAWERGHGRQADQERFLASSAEAIAAAQRPDGYLNTYVQVVQGDRRFADPAMGHELYCAGHLMQAAVADIRTAGGAGALALTADRFASFLADVLPGQQAAFVPGHPEIEMALVEMYRTNGDRRLVQLAGDLVGRRGHGSLRWHSFEPEYFQDEVPFEEAMTIRGHAVRALYLLCGATDLYAETGRSKLLTAALSQWHDMVSAKTYVTGGVGSRHKDEAFGDAYELPPDRAYCETCATIASVMWNWRLLLLSGDSVYADLMERALYNSFLAGLGLDGTSFFYVNPLQVRRPTTRQAWYDCACCPPNVMRLMASLEHYVATQTTDGLQVHQYVTGTARAEQAAGGALEVALETGYPFDGTVRARLEAVPPNPAEIALRLPAWATGARCSLNDRPVASAPSDNGYLRLRHRWSVGDEIVLELPLRPRAVTATEALDGARGCVAYERGPLVYCLEGTDLEGRVDIDAVAVDAAVPASVVTGVDIAGERVAGLGLTGVARQARPKPPWPYREAETGNEHAPADVGSVAAVSALDGTGLANITLRAVPYYAWGNRGATAMRVWVPRHR